MFNGSRFPFDSEYFHQFPNELNRQIDNETYYKILEVDKNASIEEINKSFKQKALILHPDKGGDPVKFQELSEAHDVISDPEQRKIYDKYGEKGIKEGIKSHQSGSIFDLIHGPGRYQTAQKKGKKRTKDIIYPLKISLQDVYQGKQCKLSIMRNKLCDKCQGVGGKKKQKCLECDGKGIVIKMIQFVPGFFQQHSSHCSNCKGKGSIIKKNDKCKNCSGQGITIEQKIISIDIIPGIPDGYTFTFYGESNQAEDYIPGDIIVEIQILDNNTFKRNGFDLIHKTTISLCEALTGVNIQLIHLDGKSKFISTQPGEIIKPGDIKTVKGLGLPKFTTPYESGNLFIQFEVKFPEKGSLSQKSIENLNEALTFLNVNKQMSAMGQQKVHSVKDFSECDLNPYSKQNNREIYEEDNYKDGRSGGIECQQM